MGFEVSSCHGVAYLFEGIELCTASNEDQFLLFGVGDPFEPASPILHFMNLIEDPEALRKYNQVVLKRPSVSFVEAFQVPTTQDFSEIADVGKTENGVLGIICGDRKPRANLFHASNLVAAYVEDCFIVLHYQGVDYSPVGNENRRAVHMSFQSPDSIDRFKSEGWDQLFQNYISGKPSVDWESPQGKNISLVTQIYIPPGSLQGDKSLKDIFESSGANDRNSLILGENQQAVRWMSFSSY